MIDLRNQAVRKELASSNSDSNDSRDYEWGSKDGKGKMEPNDEGVLELEDCFEDETSSPNGLFHWLRSLPP